MVAGSSFPWMVFNPKCEKNLFQLPAILGERRNFFLRKVDKTEVRVVRFNPTKKNLFVIFPSMVWVQSQALAL